MYYYITTHGVGPGTVPKGLNIVSVSYLDMKSVIETDVNLSSEELSKYDMFRYCPLCNHAFCGYPSISRKDNKTNICPACGVKEAIHEYESYLKGGNK